MNRAERRLGERVRQSRTGPVGRFLGRATAGPRRGRPHDLWLERTEPEAGSAEKQSHSVSLANRGPAHEIEEEIAKEKSQWREDGSR